MEKHIAKFCEQNPDMEIKCPACNKKLKIKTKDFLKTKNAYKSICKYCNNSFTYDTSKMFKELEIFKKLC